MQRNAEKANQQEKWEKAGAIKGRRRESAMVGESKETILEFFFQGLFFKL